MVEVAQHTESRLFTKVLTDGKPKRAIVDADSFDRKRMHLTEGDLAALRQEVSRRHISRALQRVRVKG